jgi:type IV secretory pathway VirB10-like protein
MKKRGFFRSLVNKTLFEEAKFASETRQKFKLGTILIIFGSILTAVMVGIMVFTPNDNHRPARAPPKIDYPTGASIPKDPNTSDASKNNNQRFAGGGGSGGYGASGKSGNSQGRSRTANQVIRRGANGNDPGAQIPMGSVIRAQLINTIFSANTVSPVIAVTLQETATPDGFAIPQGTKILGSASFDDQSRRIQIQFQTLIYEDGSQHTFQGMAVMPDGSAGLSGDYHSGEGKRQLGEFFGNFVGGLADGMKDRSASGGFYGGSIEPGSIKNGLLNGVAISASDESKNIATDMGNEKPSMTIQGGFQFLIFLQKEFIP